MQKLLTIAVPTYNIENYIHRNIESFQAVSDELKSYFEVLIINDGSKDSSVEVVEKLISEDEQLNIRIVNKENGGHGSAVNRGIEEAKGKYFKIIDGDDWINPKAFEIYLHRLLDEDADMIVTDFRRQYIQDGTSELVKVLDFEDRTRFSQYPIQRIYMHSITYKTNILVDHHIRLSEGVFYVDMQYVYFPQQFVKSFVYWNLDLYQYLLGRGEQSVNWKSLLKNESHHLLVTNSLLELYNQTQDENLKMLYSVPLNSMINITFLILGLNQSDIQMKEFAKAVQLSNFVYRYSKDRKTSYFMYVSETNSIVKPFFAPFINHKLKMMKQGIEAE